MSLAVHAAPPARRQELLEDLDAAFARFLRLDVANGDAALDTVRGYRSQLAAWVAWCAEHAVDARTATTDDIKRYREDLVAQGRRPTTIAHKLNVLRRVYAAAVAAGLRADNPAVGIRAPRDRRAPEDFGYLAARGRVQPDTAGEPLLTAVGNFASGHRLSRRGVRHVVDSYLRAAKVKRPRVSNHALRHTGATLAYRYTHDLRAVQDMLGHQDPKTTARYARVVDRAKTNPALKVPVEL